MKEYWYPTSFSGWGEEEHAAIARVIESNRFTIGPETEAFEAELAAFNHRKYAICVNSGSSANLLAVSAMMNFVELQNKDEINYYAAMPALAWGTTYAPLVQFGLTPSLVDCGDNWCIDYNNYEPEHDCVVMVSCSILGNPANLDMVHPDVPWLNDDCEAFGCTINGRPTGSYADIATQSFFWSHQLGAIEGGACLTDDAVLANTMRCLRDHGMSRYMFKDHPPKTFADEYRFLFHGFNFRPVEMHMAIAREQLKKVPVVRTHRMSNWLHFASLAVDLPIILPPLAEGANPFGIHFELMDLSLRDSLARALRDHAIDCRLPTGGSYHLHPYGLDCADQPTPRADRIHNAGMFLGNAPYPIEEKIDKAITVIREITHGHNS